MRFGMRVFLAIVCLAVLGVIILETLDAIQAIHHSMMPSSHWLLQGTPTNQEVVPNGVQIQWRVYGKETQLRNRCDQHLPGFNISNQALLDSVSTSLQKSMLRAIPLNCHPGPEGVFKQMHSQFLQTLAEYATTHSHMKSDPSSRTLTWMCIYRCGGLADRIRGITYSLLLAIFSQRRLIIFMDGVHEGEYLHPNLVDWRDEGAYQYLRGKETGDLFTRPFTFNARASGGGLEVKMKSGLSSIAENLEVVRSNRVKNIVISTNLKPSAILIDPDPDSDWIATAVKRIGLSGLSLNDFDAVMGPAVRYLFKLDNQVLKELLSAKDTLGLTCPYTALHVRTGFVGTGRREHSNASRLQGDPSQWLEDYRCAVSIAHRSLGENSLIYLATDSNNVKQMAIENYPSTFQSLDNKLLHVGKKAASDTKEGFLVAWIEMFLMAEGNILVRGESGYSWISSFLCGLQSNRTVDTSNCVTTR